MTREAYNKAAQLAYEHPWLPRYDEDCRRTRRWLAVPEASMWLRVLPWPGDTEMLLIREAPIQQPVRGRPDAAAASRAFGQSTPFDINARNASGDPVLSLTTRLSHDVQYLQSLQSPQTKRWYVVFVGKQLGVFDDE